ncbi:hypothetical protein OFB83_27625, partial [Escherichia coli]|nr:hypothetical protein [Escherichia coli]
TGRNNESSGAERLVSWFSIIKKWQTSKFIAFLFKNTVESSLHIKNGARNRESRYIHTAGFRATITIETPNGKSKCLSQKRSAAKTRPKSPFKAETLMLFSDAGLIPLSRIRSRPMNTGRKKVKLAYVARSMLEPACLTRP